MKVYRENSDLLEPLIALSYGDKFCDTMNHYPDKYKDYYPVTIADTRRR
ncbi:MAG TPA: hypothetical protein VJR94_07820 [Candidatus Nitrosocosmicus sp.]|nr:hypothetical protein [Candidatus Nitrosocosmicus sp.]